MSCLTLTSTEFKLILVHKINIEKSQLSFMQQQRYLAYLV